MASPKPLEMSDRFLKAWEVLVCLLGKKRLKKQKQKNTVSVPCATKLRTRVSFVFLYSGVVRTSLSLGNGSLLLLAVVNGVQPCDRFVTGNLSAFFFLLVGSYPAKEAECNFRGSEILCSSRGSSGERALCFLQQSLSSLHREGCLRPEGADQTEGHIHPHSFHHTRVMRS